MKRVDDLILVVLPTLGERLDTFRLTLLSIEQQKHDVGVRLVVVVPKTAEKARAIAVSFGAELVDDPGTGISAAINQGLMARKGEEFYSWMGDDDLFRPGGLLKLKTLIRSNPNNVVAYGGCVYINEKGSRIGVNKSGKIANFLLPWGPDLIPHPGSIIRIDSLFSVGLYDESLKYAMDLDVFLKLRKIGKFASTTEEVSAFRWHSNSLTVSGRKASSMESEAVKRRYLRPALRKFSFLWEIPVRYASSFAAKQVNAKSLELLR